VDGQKAGFSEGEEMSEQIQDNSGVGIGCHCGKEGQQMVQITLAEPDLVHEGHWAYHSLPMDDAEELFVQALKMIRARRERLAKKWYPWCPECGRKMDD